MGRNFDGAGDNIALGDVTAARFPADAAWTFLAFFRIENSTGDDRCIVAKNASTSTRQFLLRTDAQAAPTNIEVYSWNGINSYELRIAGGDNVELDTWYLVCVTNDGIGASDSLTLYLVDMAGTYQDDGLTGPFDDGNSSLTAGVFIGETGEGSDDMDGDIAHACYVSAEITKPEVSAYLRNPWRMSRVFKAKYGAPFYLPLIGIDSPESDWSGNGNGGTVTGTTRGDSPPVALLTPRHRATTPVIVEGGAQTITLSALSVTAQIAAPGVSGSGVAQIAPSPVSVAAQSVAPSVSGSGAVSVAPSPVGVVSQAVSPVVSPTGAAVIAPSPVEVTAQAVSPSIGNDSGQQIALSPVSASAQIAAPGVSGSGAVQIAPSPVSVAAQSVAPSVSGSGVVSVALSPVTAQGQVNAPSLAAAAGAVEAPTDALVTNTGSNEARVTNTGSNEARIT